MRNNILIIFLSLSITACSSTKLVKVNDPFPEAPKELMKEPVKLTKINLKKGEELSLSELLSVMTDNYSSSSQNAEQIKAWQEWYKTNKEIYDAGK